MTQPKKLSVEEQRGIIPDDEIYRAFCRRPDVQKMSDEGRAVAWAEQVRAIERFRQMLSTVPSYVIPEEPR